MKDHFHTPVRPKFEYDTEYSNTYLHCKKGSRSISNYRTNSRLFNHGQLTLSESKKNRASPHPEIRYLPIVPKKGVANEWAAILKLKDEKDKQKDRREKELIRHKQVEYRAELENQIKLQKSRSKSNMDSYIADQNDRDHRNQVFEKYGCEIGKAKKEIKCLPLYKNKEKEVLIAKESMKEVQKRNQEKKAINKLENDQFKLAMLHNNRVETERMATKRAKKLLTQAQIRNTLDKQLESKRKALKHEKELDKKILGIGLKQEENKDLQRDLFFSRLRRMQDANISKTEKLKANDVAKKAAEKDNKEFMKNIKSQEKKWEEQEKKDQQRKRQKMIEMQQGLNSQILKKANESKQNKKVDEMYGRMLKERDQIDLLREQEEKNQFRVQQKHLYKGLNDQNKLNSDKNRYEDMMSDQERRMNNRDLEVYQGIKPVLTSRRTGISQYLNKSINSGRNWQREDHLMRPSGSNNSYGGQISFDRNEKQNDLRNSLDILYERGRNRNNNFTLLKNKNSSNIQISSSLEKDPMSYIQKSEKLFRSTNTQDYDNTKSREAHKSMFRSTPLNQKGFSLKATPRKYKIDWPITSKIFRKVQICENISELSQAQTKRRNRLFVKSKRSISKLYKSS
ncbi:unnamed protein product [Moneuplotes crassus]|uniref:Trichohyalin-plectin-homology domain-containing protein n=1 Tax=Euplotes crassus TaxID=5936 RepID=A0AAD1U2H9_EUPCR|nr:unnamed protein product [Moneuplotes crassus]